MSSKTSRNKAEDELKEGLEKFRTNALKQGWEEEDIKEKLTEVFQNFPWYKFKKQKTSWTSRILKFLFYCLIAYLIFNAVLEKNAKLKKKFNDFWHDYELVYHQTRIMRLIALPIFNFYDLSQFYNAECLVKNPFAKQEELSCELCENVFGIDRVDTDSDLEDKIGMGGPLVVTHMKDRKDSKVTFDDIKKMFSQYSEELDDAICKVQLNEDFKKVSEFFKLTEKEVIDKGHSIQWKNCHTYGTRFYRQLFFRPDFIANTSEVSLEKDVMVLQKDMNVTLDVVGQGEMAYLSQTEGSSILEFNIPSDCSHNCSSNPLTAKLNTGEIAIFPSNFWHITLRSISDGLSIVYHSSYT